MEGIQYIYIYIKLIKNKSNFFQFVLIAQRYRLFS